MPGSKSEKMNKTKAMQTGINTRATAPRPPSTPSCLVPLLFALCNNDRRLLVVSHALIWQNIRVRAYWFVDIAPWWNSCHRGCTKFHMLSHCRQRHMLNHICSVTSFFVGLYLFTSLKLRRRGPAPLPSSFLESMHAS